MSDLHKLSTPTKVGNLEFIGTPVSNDFDYKSFALNNGFIYTTLDSIQNTDKYGGVGFFVAKNHSSSSEISSHLKKRLEVLFIDGLPIMYKVV